jgi:hypothetical protein
MLEAQVRPLNWAATPTVNIPPTAGKVIGPVTPVERSCHALSWDFTGRLAVCRRKRATPPLEISRSNPVACIDCCVHPPGQFHGMVAFRSKVTLAVPGAQPDTVQLRFGVGTQHGQLPVATFFVMSGQPVGLMIRNPTK